MILLRSGAGNPAYPGKERGKTPEGMGTKPEGPERSVGGLATPGGIGGADEVSLGPIRLDQGPGDAGTPGDRPSGNPVEAGTVMPPAPLWRVSGPCFLLFRTFPTLQNASQWCSGLPTQDRPDPLARRPAAPPMVAWRAGSHIPTPSPAALEEDLGPAAGALHRTR